MPADGENGRTHEPSLRELTAELDGLRDVLRVQLERIDEKIDERDRRYGESFTASKDAVKAALDAQKELTAAAFAASREAINKAEITSTANDAKNNEFRGQLRDQAATFPTRLEMEGQVSSVASRVEEMKKDQERYRENQATEIRSLRESRSQSLGTGIATRELLAWAVGIASIVYVIIRVATGH